VPPRSVCKSRCTFANARLSAWIAEPRRICGSGAWYAGSGTKSSRSLPMLESQRWVSKFLSVDSAWVPATEFLLPDSPPLRIGLEARNPLWRRSISGLDGRDPHLLPRGLGLRPREDPRPRESVGDWLEAAVSKWAFADAALFTSAICL